MVLVTRPFSHRIAAVALTITALSGTVLVTTASLAQTGVVSANQPYTLRPYDILDISVVGHDELHTTVTVLPDGTIAYPEIGTINAGGKTAADLTSLISKKLSDYVIQPEVTVLVHERTLTVSVLGAVKSPGQFPTIGDTHLLDALALAGGLNQDAQDSQVTVLTDSGQKNVAIDVPTLMSGEDRTQNVLLSPSDVVLVQASTSQVQVTGEVNKPGSYEIPSDGASVLTVLTDAGGTLSDAALSQAQILHNGKAVTVNLKSASDLSTAVNGQKLYPGDVLEVPAVNNKVGILGSVRTPGAIPIPDGGSLSTTAALLAAGGTTDDADLKNAYLLTRDPDGTAHASKVNVDALLRGQSGVPDQTLVAGDILYIPAKGESHGISPLNFLPIISTLAVVAHH